jgi:ubiquinone/menaquinone biosynthesis C-methylase UbiE
MPTDAWVHFLKSGMTLYDLIGTTYSQTRRCDPRILAKSLDILASSPAKTIVDIGAGTGSYAMGLAEQGYLVLAVEPSTTMRHQAIAHPNITWLDGVAECLPLANQAADAAIVMLAIQHFQSHQQALQEIGRVVGPGQIIIFTYDPAMISSFWLTDYFPEFINDVESTFLPITQLKDEIQSVTGREVQVTPFPLPQDLTDSFAAVGWAQPERYLDSKIRDGISSFAKFNTQQLSDGLARLQADLSSGAWDQRHGYLRQQTQYDLGYCFVHCSAK